MVQTIRERMARVNAEKLAENTRPEHTAFYWRGIVYDNSATELADDIHVELHDAVPLETFIGDSTDIFDADSEDIADYLAMFYPHVYASFDADNPAYD